jgi:diketogulonate reductase-like aldo/keto reductase
MSSTGSTGRRVPVPTRPLAGDVEIPMVGLGVYQSTPGHTTRGAVLAALDAGYRHIDTAAVYRNEPDVGEAIRRSSIPREEVFVTTKLSNSNHGYDPALRAFDRSLNRLGFEYVDLYLVHWPVPEERLETWRAMERILADGRARAIGVSNYMLRHIDELMTNATVPPAVNQFELSPYLARWGLVDRCRELGIAVETYSPLTKGRKLRDRVLIEMAMRYGKSPAQILIRWALDHGFVVIPKSVHPRRIRENIDVFDFSLDADDLASLDALDEGLITGWDPTNAP